jgi:hypothetical protein
LLQIDPRSMASNPTQSLPNGFERSVQLQRWGVDLQLATVTVLLPDGRALTVSRLLEGP